ncbi:conserved hypothetical protein [Candidatus Nitrotoga sp. HW29]|uniref:hypothetical protein n=1 Tax=Candidatus Nitrotoga sp. HW29 TaxID=2886963 RepID=UPI001EF2126E|nr:hypothetical protein [Candidatus Nitrotoga sp. HW29]CAH1904903.1 conserved hypothetical protein [Candidatus Nitrotoga sp. HW29]
MMKIRHEKIMNTAFCFLKKDAKRLFVYIGNVIDDFRLRNFSFAKRALLIGMIFGVLTTAKAENVTIHPANPMNLESVVTRIHDYYTCGQEVVVTQVQQIGTAIRVDIRAPESCIDFGVPPLTSYRDVDIKLGQFPSGVFSVDIFRKNISNTGITPQEIQIGSAQFTVTNNNATKTGVFPFVDYTDHWWNPQESGMGFSIMQHPSDRIFAVWFVYDQAGQPTWYTLQPGQWLSSTVYTGPIYKTTGTYLGVTYDPGQLVVTPVGTGTFSFHSYSSATFAYTVEGKEGTKEITRLSF